MTARLELTKAFRNPVALGSGMVARAADISRLVRPEAIGPEETSDPELRIPLSFPAPSVVTATGRLEFTLAFLSKLKFEAEETARLPERRPDILPEDVVPEVIP